MNALEEYANIVDTTQGTNERKTFVDNFLFNVLDNANALQYFERKRLKTIRNNMIEASTYKVITQVLIDLQQFILNLDDGLNRDQASIVTTDLDFLYQMSLFLDYVDSEDVLSLISKKEGDNNAN